MKLDITHDKPMVRSSITFTYKEMVEALTEYARSKGFNFPGLDECDFCCMDHGCGHDITYHLGNKIEGTEPSIIGPERE